MVQNLEPCKRDFVQRIELGSRLVEERKRLGLSQTALGQVGGVSKGSQILYEKGEGVPTGDYLAAIAVAGADVQYILTGVRSSVALTPDERLLIDRYRQSPQPLKDAALRVVLGGGDSVSPSESVKTQYVVSSGSGQAAGRNILNKRGKS